MAPRSESGWRWMATSQKFAVGAGSLLYEQQTPSCLQEALSAFGKWSFCCAGLQVQIGVRGHLVDHLLYM
jgi:hypothetical protein